jgi:hypothetical protein
MITLPSNALPGRARQDNMRAAWFAFGAIPTRAESAFGVREGSWAVESLVTVSNGGRFNRRRSKVEGEAPLAVSRGPQNPHKSALWQ